MYICLCQSYCFSCTERAVPSVWSDVGVLRGSQWASTTNVLKKSLHYDGTGAGRVQTYTIRCSTRSPSMFAAGEFRKV